MLISESQGIVDGYICKVKNSNYSFLKVKYFPALMSLKDLYCWCFVHQWRWSVSDILLLYINIIK